MLAQSDFSDNPRRGSDTVSIESVALSPLGGVLARIANPPWEQFALSRIRNPAGEPRPFSEKTL